MEPVFAALTAFAVAALPLAVGVTKAVDFARNLLDKDDSYPKVIWQASALGFGLLVCLGWGFNVFAALADSVPALATSSALDGVWGDVLTGITIGAMASFWHEKLDEWSSSAKASRTPS